MFGGEGYESAGIHIVLQKAESEDRNEEGFDDARSTIGEDGDRSKLEGRKM